MSKQLSAGAFARENQIAEAWVADVMAELQTKQQPEGIAAIRAALHALRDRLSTNEAAQLAAQLPLVIRGLFYEGWNPRPAIRRERRLEAFLEHVRQELSDGRHYLEPERAASAVFAVLARRVSPGEIRDVIASLPQRLRGLWPAALGAEMPAN